MNKLQQAAARTKAVYLRNERRLLFGALAVTTTFGALEAAGIRQHNDFLREHDLFDAFYTPNKED